jgi:ATP-dependent RNA helicase DDX3X
MESFSEIEAALYTVDNANNAPGPVQPPTSEAATETPLYGAAPGQWSAPVAFDYESFNEAGFTEWAGNAVRYEWKDEYGDVGPRNEELEKQLFQVDFISRAGHRLDRYLPHLVHLHQWTLF